MAKQTISDRLVAGLKAQGFLENTGTRTRKAREFLSDSHPDRYFVGKAGSLRVGRTYTTSTPVLPQTKRHVIRKGEIALGIASTVAAVQLSDEDKAQIRAEAEDRRAGR